MNYTYTYDDIQIIPTYSEVESRRDCNLSTRFTRNYTLSSPVVSAPMDTVTEKDMANAMSFYGGIGIVHRFMSIDAQVYQVVEIQKALYSVSKADFSNTNQEYTKSSLEVIKDILNNQLIPVATAIGATGDYKERAWSLAQAGANILLIDVAHGNTKQVRDAIKWCKENLPGTVDVIAGNVATYEGARNIAEWGADAIRVGIGNGCFTPDMLVKTTDGLKRIVDVSIGDSVYTHTGEIHQVINKFEYNKNEEIVVVNDIESTSNHEFYVIHQSVADIVNEDNIHQYAEWIPAGELTNEYFLIELE